MKSILLFIIPIAVMNVYSQNLPIPHCSGNINVVTTDWRVSGSPNTWNWTTEYFDNAYIKNRNIQPSTVRSPFYPAITGQNLNLDHFYSQHGNHGYDGLDFHPEDGWELLVKDFGSACPLAITNCDGNNPNAVSNLFFALYNRYTSVIRVFYLIAESPNVPQNGAAIRLFISTERKNGLLEPTYAELKPLVEFRKNVVTHAANKYENEEDFWLYADFPVGYDPCICNYQSRITFQFQLIQSGELEMTGSIVGVTTQVLGPGAGGNVNATAPYQTIFDRVTQGFDIANKSYKKWDNFRNYADKFIDKNKAVIKDAMNVDLAKLKVVTKKVPKIATAAAN
jgi:hypothetical protein